MTTYLSSPCVSGMFHCIHLARANSGLSMAMTGVWPGLRCWTTSLTTFIRCQIIAEECEFSKNNGKRATMSTCCTGEGCSEVGNAAQDIKSSGLIRFYHKET